MRTRFFVNPVKGVVVAMVRNKKHFGKGIARCNLTDGDVFDEEKGKAVAVLRAKQNLEWAKYKAHSKTANRLERLLQAEDNALEAIHARMQALEVEIEESLKDL